MTQTGHSTLSYRPEGIVDLDGYADSAYALNAHNVLESGLTNSDILFLTAHPDDESMFFTPTILELGKANYNNTLHLLCLSDGNADGLGTVRARELAVAARLLGFASYHIGTFVDGPTLWDRKAIVEALDERMSALYTRGRKTVLVTFDGEGVSGHPNHVSLHTAARAYAKTHPRVPVWCLQSWPLAVKYSGFLLANAQLIVEYLGEGVKTAVNSQLQRWGMGTLGSAADSSSLLIHSSIHSWFLAMSTMTWAHYSQMVSFRWGWLVLSKYMNSNELSKL